MRVAGGVGWDQGLQTHCLPLFHCTLTLGVRGTGSPHTSQPRGYTCIHSHWPLEDCCVNERCHHLQRSQSWSPPNTALNENSHLIRLQIYQSTLQSYNTVREEWCKRKCRGRDKEKRPLLKKNWVRLKLDKHLRGKCKVICSIPDTTTIAKKKKDWGQAQLSCEALS